MHIIAGLYRQQRLDVPKGQKTRPTSSRLRESIFNICQGSIKGASFLDLFAGSGAMGFEALSRGAQLACFVEKDKEAIQCIQKNASQLNVHSHCQIFYGNVFQVLKKFQNQGKQFDIIYADPPYHTLTNEEQIPYSTKIVQWIDQSSLLSFGGVFFIEEASEVQLQMDSLESLFLKSTRRLGRTFLYQYEKKIHPSSS
jgi:16S rRNA (guanine966-N2)-methyltransferase